MTQASDVLHISHAIDQSSARETAKRALRAVGQVSSPETTVYWAGNGGCASLADHMAAELVTGFGHSPGLRSVSLSCNTSLLTAIANDLGVAAMFSAQISVLTQPSDAVFFLSTSGTSQNIVAGIKEARRCGARSVLLTGSVLPTVAPHLDVCVCIGAASVQRLQDEMLAICHEICRYLLEATHA